MQQLTCAPSAVVLTRGRNLPLHRDSMGWVYETVKGGKPGFQHACGDQHKVRAWPLTGGGLAQRVLLVERSSRFLCEDAPHVGTCACTQDVWGLMFGDAVSPVGFHVRPRRPLRWLPKEACRVTAAREAVGPARAGGVSGV